MDRRHFLAGSAAAMLMPNPARARSPVRIALLLPMTGALAEMGKMLQGTALVALEAVNRHALRPIIAETEDWRSDPRRFDALVRGLGAGQGRPASLFGPCPDTLREAVGAFLDEYGGLLWDPAGYGGGECSGGVLHGGPTPYQGLKQLLPFMAEEVGSRFLLVGGERPTSRALNRAARHGLGRMGAQVVGEAMRLADHVTALARGGFDVVLCSLEGAELVDFLAAYSETGLDPQQFPIASPTMSEFETRAAGTGIAAGHVACQPYFAGLRTLGNDRFLAALRKRLGPGFTPTAMAEALWGQIHLFARAVDTLDDLQPHPMLVREAAKAVEIVLPQGRVRLDPKTLHMALWPKIAVAEEDGGFKVIAKSELPVPALPFWGNGGKGCPERPVDEPV